MSEYQYVVFQAVDGPLTQAQLKFARQQSSRAEVSAWRYSVEYNYSYFGGDIDGLLRGGYDVFLQFTNYGTREIRWRLPYGLPANKAVWSRYLTSESLEWKPDPKGPGGILSIRPYFDSSGLDEIWEAEEYLAAAIQVRELLVAGDLRPLYLLWLCSCDDNIDRDELTEPPVPDGIADIAGFGGDLLWFFGLDPLMLTAVGEDIPSAPVKGLEDSVSGWVQALDETRAKSLLGKFLNEEAASVKAAVLAEIRDSQTPDNWPVTDRQRSFVELIDQTDQLRKREYARLLKQAAAKAKREAKKAAKVRAERLQAMVKNPDKWLRDADRLVAARGTENYEAAADLLFDLREAIGGDEGETITRRHAAHLTKKYPTLSRLKGSLRKRDLY